MPQQPPAIGSDVTSLMPQVGADVSSLMGQIPRAPVEQAAPEPSLWDKLAAISSAAEQFPRDVGTGIVKGAASTAVNLGQLVSDIPGFAEGVNALYRKLGIQGVDTKAALATAESELEPTNTAQQIGRVGEQTAEFLAPVGAGERLAVTVAQKAAPVFRNAPRLVRAAVQGAPRVAAQAATTGGVATAQGGDPTSAAVMGGALPVVGGAVNAGARWVGRQAIPLVRAAIKPTVAAMKRIANASVEGIDAQATRLARFILDNRLTTGEQARAILTESERELQRVLSVKNAPTDAPQRAMKYLSALERSASKQGLPAQDVATLRNAAAEVLQSGLGKDVVTMVPKPHPTLVGANGKPLTVLVPETTRALRTDVGAQEALERARATSRWDTRKAWGEQKGAATEASKAIERAERDALKAAVPEARPILQREGQAIQARETLDRMAFRAANRDALSLPAHVVAAGEIAAGSVPKLAFAANWLRNNQLKAGIWADRLSKAITEGNVPEVSAILGRLGVAYGAVETQR